ncbi:MAG: hypothetical protein ACLFU4_02485 [Opitutales bacterium]
MSTTWVFLGLLAGREVGIALRLRHRKRKKVANLVFGDAGKAFFGSVIAIMLALFLPMFMKPVASAIDAKAAAEEASAVRTEVELDTEALRQSISTDELSGTADAPADQ